MKPLLVAAALALIAPSAFAQSAGERCRAEAVAAREHPVAGSRPFATLYWSGALARDCTVLSFHVAFSPYVPARNGQPAAFGKPMHAVRVWSASFQGEPKISYASSATCPAVRTVMEKLAALESPKINVPGLVQKDDLAIGTDGTTYRLWTNRTLVPGQRVEGRHDMEYSGWNDSLLDPFATETMHALNTCLSPTEPAKPTQ